MSSWAVPGLARAVPGLHVADAPLQEPAGDQELAGMDAGAVQVADVLRGSLETSKASSASDCIR